MEDKEKKEILGKNVKKFRKRLNLTLVDLEVMTGLDSGDLSRIETGQVNITFTKLVKIAESLKVSLNDLYLVQD